MLMQIKKINIMRFDSMKKTWIEENLTGECFDIVRISDDLISIYVKG